MKESEEEEGPINEITSGTTNNKDPNNNNKYNILLVGKRIYVFLSVQFKRTK